MSARKHAPRNGLARALLEADKDTPVSDLPQLLEDVARWQCENCTRQKFTRPVQCSECSSEEFVKVDPKETNHE